MELVHEEADKRMEQNMESRKWPKFIYRFRKVRDKDGQQWPVVKNLPANPGDARDASSISESGISPGRGNGNPLQCSCGEKIPWTGKLGRRQSMGSQKNWTQLSSSNSSRDKKRSICLYRPFYISASIHPSVYLQIKW